MSPRSTRRRAVFAAGAVLAAVALLAVGCSSPESVGSQQKPTDQALPDDGAPQGGGTLVVGIYQETSGWNPTYDRWAQMGALVGSSILEPLAALDQNGVAQPWLATSWESNPDFTSWTIHLREGVVFQDGTAFDADSVKANIDDATIAPLTGLAFKPLIGGSTKVDDHTIRVDLLTPWAAFPTAYLASQGAMQRSPGSIAQHTGSDHPVGTGPFAFKDWKRDSSLVVEKNTHYWRQGEPHLDRIEFRPIIEDGSRASALRANDVDLMFTTSAKDADELDRDFTVVRDWDTESTMLIANTREKVGDELNPMHNIHGRRAIAMATDRKYLAALIGDGVQLYNSPFSPNSPWGQPDEQAGYPAYNQDEARKEVAAYLKDTGQTEMSVAVIGPNDSGSAGIMQALQAQWAEVGIKSTVKTFDTTALIQGLLGWPCRRSTARPTRTRTSCSGRRTSSATTAS